MRSDVIVSFGPDDDRTFHVEAMRDPGEARAWLDQQFLELDCEPLRASGKVLVADKLLAVADAAGVELFADAHGELLSRRGRCCVPAGALRRAGGLPRCHRSAARKSLALEPVKARYTS